MIFRTKSWLAGFIIFSFTFFLSKDMQSSAFIGGFLLVVFEMMQVIKEKQELLTVNNDLLSKLQDSDRSALALSEENERLGRRIEYLKREGSYRKNKNEMIINALKEISKDGDLVRLIVDSKGDEAVINEIINSKKKGVLKKIGNIFKKIK